MGWRSHRLGPANLTDNWSRLEALDQARIALGILGFGKATIKEMVEHERDHLYAFPDFEESSGKKLRLDLEEDPDEGVRLVVVPNRLHLREDVRRSLAAVENPSEGDLNYGCLSRFKRRK